MGKQFRRFYRLSVLPKGLVDTAEISIEGLGTAVRFGKRDDCPLLFEHNGKLYATNLFKLHDTHGFPLAYSLIECNRRGWYPCTQQFIADALKAGWPRERAVALVEEAQRDAVGVP